MLIFIFILGLCIGSFLNVCISRIPSEDSIANGRSKCPNCNHTLGIFDLMPLFSYLLLRGRCRYCKIHISWQYPIVELITGIIYLLLFYKYGYSVNFLATSILCCCAIVAAFIDFEHGIIPNELTLFTFSTGLVVQTYHLITKGYSVYGNTSNISGFIGLLMVIILFSLIYGLSYLYYKREALGMGDIKFYLGISLFLGWQLTLIALWITIILACIVMLILLGIKKISRQSEFPLGPFISLGLIIAILIGYDLLNLWLYGVL